uniref:Major sperm protein n=1 Tax=Romanomermis culicivorax TaxID=13658 RepID=A0A915KXK4_ROMCU
MQQQQMSQLPMSEARSVRLTVLLFLCRVITALQQLIETEEETLHIMTSPMPEPPCPLQASPHVATFDGPFDKATNCKIQVKNVGPTKLCINVKIALVDFLSSKPRCFFVDPKEEVTVKFKHTSFLGDPDDPYKKHQIGFFYMDVEEQFQGTAREYKNYANEQKWEWSLCRLRVKLNFTDQDRKTFLDNQITEEVVTADANSVDFEAWICLYTYIARFRVPYILGKV